MQKVSLDLLKKRLKRYPHLDHLERFLNRIKNEKIKLILLYGSLAKNTFTQYSDIDILCVFDREFNDMEDRFMSSYKYSEGIVQPKNLSYAEFKKSLKEGNSFVLWIMNEGFILYSDIPEEKIETWIEQGKQKNNTIYNPPQ